MKILIGALGKGNYDGTSYIFEDDSVQEADYFIYALARHIRPDHVFVVVTEEAKQSALPNLTEWMELENLRLTPIEIPKGRNRGEAWEIFNFIVTAYESVFAGAANQHEVYLDITSGFRSLSVLLLSVARYLQKSQRIKLGGIFYGAYDSVERNVIPKPVYQIDSFITVLDWAAAIDSFLNTGNSVQLAELFQTQELEIDDAKIVADALRRLSYSLDLVSIEEIHKRSFQLVEAIKRIDIYVLKGENRVIAELLQQLRDEFDVLALENPQNNISLFIKKNLKLVFWYLDRSRFQDAMLVAREWMITYRMQHKNTDKGIQPVESVFDRDKRVDGFHQWRAKDKKALHKEINDIRNSLAHCGFSAEETVGEMIDRIDNVIARLRKLETAL